MAGERVQRRLAAILVADVAGYSRLMGADEEGTLARLKAHRAELIDPALAAHGGRLVKLTGDGALVEFASVVDAVRCAIEIQMGMAERNASEPEDRRIQFRIGVNLGDIMIDGDDIYGDGVNIAARLEALAEPGDVVVSAKVHDEMAARLDTAFDDLGERTVKNVARPVRAFRVRTGSAKPAGSAAAGSTPLPLPDTPSIAVLPFENMSGEADQEYFADGMAEDIITALSRFRWFFVIARNSSFIYKGKSVDMRQVGRELGVRYVLEGSVRKGGNRLRFTAQLIEAESGNHIWAERYDGGLEDVFDLQDRITEGVVGAVEPSVRQAEIERARRKRPDSLDAYDLYLRALSESWATTPAAATAALTHLVKALDIDPAYPAVHALAAVCRYRRFIRGSADPEERAAGVRHARIVLASGTDDAIALAQAAFVLHAIGGDSDAARNALDRAMTLNPNSAQVVGYSASVNADLGYYERAVEEAHRSIRLSPFDPTSFRAEMTLVLVHYCSGRFDEAAEAALRTIGANPQFGLAHAFLAASYQKVGRTAEAKAAIRRLLDFEPSFRVAVLRNRAPAAGADMEGLFAALREAGLPD